MTVTVRFTLNESAFRRLNAPTGDIGRAVARGAGKLRDDAKRIITEEGRVDTGAMRQGVISEHVRTDSNGVYYQVTAKAPYSIYQELGVKGPVLPRRAKVLRFKPKGANGFIFRASTRGFSGIHFLTRALRNLSANDFLGP